MRRRPRSPQSSPKKPNRAKRLVRRQTVADSHFQTTLRKILDNCLFICVQNFPGEVIFDERIKSSYQANSLASFCRLYYTIAWLRAAFEANDRESNSFASTADDMYNNETNLLVLGDALMADEKRAPGKTGKPDRTSARKSARK